MQAKMKKESKSRPEVTKCNWETTVHALIAELQDACIYHSAKGRGEEGSNYRTK